MQRQQRGFSLLIFFGLCFSLLKLLDDAIQIVGVIKIAIEIYAQAFHAPLVWVCKNLFPFVFGGWTQWHFQLFSVAIMIAVALNFSFYLRFGMPLPVVLLMGAKIELSDVDRPQRNGIAIASSSYDDVRSLSASVWAGAATSWLPFAPFQSLSDFGSYHAYLSIPQTIIILPLLLLFSTVYIFPIIYLLHIIWDTEDGLRDLANQAWITDTIIVVLQALMACALLVSASRMM